MTQFRALVEAMNLRADMAMDAAFNESDHPRQGGKFTSGSGGGKAAAPSKKKIVPAAQRQAAPKLNSGQRQLVDAYHANVKEYGPNHSRTKGVLGMLRQHGIDPNNAAVKAGSQRREKAGQKSQERMYQQIDNSRK